MQNLTLIPTVELWKRHEQNRYQPEIRHEIADRRLFWEDVKAQEQARGGNWRPVASLPNNYQARLDLGNY